MALDKYSPTSNHGNKQFENKTLLSVVRRAGKVERRRREAAIRVRENVQADIQSQRPAGCWFSSLWLHFLVGFDLPVTSDRWRGWLF
jgi:hypothetical protein